jgi:hypothetical protein
VSGAEPVETGPVLLVLKDPNIIANVQYYRGTLQNFHTVIKRKCPSIPKSDTVQPDLFKIQGTSKRNFFEL